MKRTKATRGRTFEGFEFRKSGGNHLSVSVKKEDLPVMYNLQKIQEESKIPVSELIMDSVRLVIGANDIELLKLNILDRYVERELKGPKLFKTFDDIICWELKNTEHIELAKKWNISRQILACIVYTYFNNPEIFY